MLIKIHSELYHGRRWNDDPRFHVAGVSFYVDYFNLFQNSHYGLACGKLIKFFNKNNG